MFLLKSLLVSQLAVLVVTAQTTSTTTTTTTSGDSRDGWRDDYKLGYSYDSLNQVNGPNHWSQVPSTIGWGEWEVVRLASAQAETNEDRLPLLKWDPMENKCGTEQRPSPIEIMPTAYCEDEEEIKVRQFNPQLDCRHPLEDRSSGNKQANEDATKDWEITPYSLRYYYPRTDRQCRRPTVRLFGIDHIDRKNQEEHFVLQWIEVHARSEHVVAGRRYDAEIQMIHMSTSRPDELAIVSVLVDASSSTDHFDFQRYLLDGWQRKAILETNQCNNNRQLKRERPHLRRGGNGEQQSSSGRGYTDVLQDYVAFHNAVNASIFFDNNNESNQRAHAQRLLQNNRCSPDKYGNGCQQQFQIGPRKRMFPYNLWPSMWYFSYTGSITAPPCQGNVHWRIMDTPLMISRRQYKQLTHLLTQSRDDRCRFDTASNLEGENFRPLQNATLSSSDRKLNDNKKKNDYYSAYYDGPQTVKHCTSDNFQVAVYQDDDQ